MDLKVECFTILSLTVTLGLYVNKDVARLGVLLGETYTDFEPHLLKIEIKGNTLTFSSMSVLIMHFRLYLTS